MSGKRCKELVVPKDCCYIRFGLMKNYEGSNDELYTVRDESMVFDLNKKGDVIGIELLASKKARKRCQE